MADEAQAAELQQLQRQLQLYDRHLASLEQNLSDLQNAVATMDGMSGSDALVPIGAGVRIKATIDPDAKVLLDLGAGYTTEVPRAEALTELRDRLQAAESAFRTTSTEAQNLAQRMQELQLRP